MKSTRKSLFLSTISLILCFAMLLGTTWAWFTDEVTSGVNQIKAGNLDVELYHSTAATVSDDVGNKVDTNTKLFENITKWEPGVIAYENFMVKNVGNLALKYQLAMNIGDKNATAEGHSLDEVLKVAVVPGGFTGDRTAAQALSYTALEEFSTSSNGALLPEETSDTFGVVIYWQPTDNDNLYNLNNGKTATVVEDKFAANELGIELGVKLFATQLEYESDSFGPDYDGSAPMKDTFEKVTETVKKEIKAGEDTVFTSIATPANEDGKTTTVTVPKEVASFAAELTSSMTVEATPTVAANNTFTVSSSNGAVGAIDLTVKVNNVVVEQFEDESGEAIPVTVETYVAKNMTNVTLEYNGTGDQPTLVSYDKTTGKLVFKTTHFSTFVLGADEVAYVESNNTAYLTIEGAIAAAQDNGDTVTLLKDCGFTGTIRTVKNFTFDLNQKTLTMSSSGQLYYGVDSSYEEHPVTEVIKDGTIDCGSSNSNYIRFEDGSGCTFENVKFTYPSATSAQKILQTYATNKNNELTENKYTFTGCEFNNAWVSFEGSSGSTNNYQLSFTDCSFKATNGSNGTNLIAIDDYDYGTLTLKNVDFTYASTGNACYCVNFDTYLDNTNGTKFNANFNNVTMNTSGTANPYTYRFMTYNSSYSDNAVITENGPNTYKHDGKTVQMFIKEISATNKSVAWTENPDAYKACRAEWVAYANATPACEGYNGSNDYLVECNGYYYIGKGQQFNDNATVTKSGDTVTKVVVSDYFTTTYNMIGTADISTQLGGNDNTNVHIYTLAKN